MGSIKIAIYARVSDDKLKEDGDRRQDVKRQTEKLLAYVRAFPEAVDIAYYTDDGKSAFKDDYQSRPEFVKLLREIRARRIQRVYVESLDRWSRRLEDGLKTIKEASDNGCTITSTMEGEIDVTNANGWFRCALGFMMAEWASRVMGDKVRSGMKRIKPCEYCKEPHLGRHPNKCLCEACRKGRSKDMSKKSPLMAASLG